MRRRPSGRVRSAAIFVVTIGLISGLAPGLAAGQLADFTMADRLASWMWPNVRPGVGPELVSIDIANVDGRPLEGAIVVGSAWPAFEARHAMRPGDTFGLIPLDRARVRGGRATI